MRILAIDVGLTKCGVCILSNYNETWEIEFWENLNLTRVPYSTQTLKKFYYPNQYEEENNDNDDDVIIVEEEEEKKEFFFLISQLPEHAAVKNSNLLKIGDKIELIYQNLKSFAPLWLLQPKLPIDLIVIEDQNSKFSTHLDEYQYIFYMFFKVYCDMNNIAIKIKFQGGFCKNKIQKVGKVLIDLHLKTLLPKKKKKSETDEDLFEKAKNKLFKEYLLTLSASCHMYIVLKKLPVQKIKSKNENNCDDDNDKKTKLEPYSKIVNDYNQKKSLNGYDKAKRLKNKIDVVINTNYMISCKMYKNNRYITWYQTLNDTNKRDPADALHHALYAMLIHDEEE